jgi:hypothetical protein
MLSGPLNLMGKKTHTQRYNGFPNYTRFLQTNCALDKNNNLDLQLLIILSSECQTVSHRLF